MQETTSPIQDRASAGSINAHAVGTYPEHRLLHELSGRELIAAAAHHLQVLLLHEERCSLRERAFDCRVPRGCFHRVFRVNLPPAARPEDLGLDPFGPLTVQPAVFAEINNVCLFRLYASTLQTSARNDGWTARWSDLRSNMSQRFKFRATSYVQLSSNM